MNRLAIGGALAALAALLLGRPKASEAKPLPSAPTVPTPKPRPRPTGTPVELIAGGLYTFTALAPEGMSQPEAVLFIQEFSGQVVSAKPGKRVALVFNWGPEVDTSIVVPGALGAFYIQSVRDAEPATEESNS